MPLGVLNNSPLNNTLNSTNNAAFTLSVDKAGEQLRRIVTTYLEKDENGNYVIPFNRQRPIMLMGAAGIGKTDAPRQAAEDLGIGFVSYSMTHHTRQSALGLPKIIEKEYADGTTLTTEYTMSEIISAVCDEIKKTGNPNGILFLDEINCISESLSAVMLQLFQNKTLGQSKIPDGWVLVMAGNPPEYNKSVKRFDAVTRDRLRIINVVPDAKAWLDYADKKALNSTVVSYISSNEDKIYCFDSDAMQIVTPRGWEELSINIDTFERHGFPITPELIAEFIGVPSVASDFYAYYDMITKCVTEKDIDDIIDGKISKELIKNIKECRTSSKHMLITCLKRKLRILSDSKNYERATKAMDNIVDFINTLYGGSGEIELFMSGILSDTEIVKMTVATHNEKFSHYLNEIVTVGTEIKTKLKSRKKEAV